METKNPLQTTVVVAAFWMATVPALSQIPNPILSERIAVTARPSPDSIVLRWAPLDLKVWRSGNDHGYRIERYVLVRGGHLLQHPEKEILRPSIKPLPEAQWERLVNENKYAAIAAQALYGDRFEVDLRKPDVFTIVNKAHENDQRFSFALFSADMSPAVARASGLWYTDKEVTKGERYLYRVVVNSADSLRGNVFLGSDDPYLLPKPQNLRADFRDQLVSLRWDKNKNISYTAYRVERSSDGKHFTRLSDDPVASISPTEKEETRYEYALDSLKHLLKVQYYRVRGITPFGEESPPSDIVSGKGMPSVTRVPYISAAENLQNTSLELRWNFPAEDNRAIKGFEVERSSKPGDRFTVLTTDLLPPPARAYKDVSPEQVNYYRVNAIGLDDEKYSSHIYFAQLIDSIPPVFPTGLEGRIGDNGTVTLSWKPNAEPDIYGYRVYKAFHKSEEPAQVTSSPLVENHFTDHVDLHALNESLYYCVMALDKNQNHSALSTLLKITLPDKVPPQPPVLLPVQSNSSGVSLRWIPGSSEDIVRYAVYRKGLAGQEWTRLSVITADNDTLFHYTDETHAPGGRNFYTVVSIDDAGLESAPARPASGGRINNTLSPAPTWRKAVVTREQSEITLRWDYDQSPVRSFQIFRALDHQRTTLCKTLAKDQKEFTDKLVPGRYYAYRIMAVFENGSKSSLSEEVQFQY